MPHSEVLAEHGLPQPERPSPEAEREMLAEVRVALLEGDITVAQAAERIYTYGGRRAPSLSESRRERATERRRRFKTDWRDDLGMSDEESRDFLSEMAAGIAEPGRAA